MRGIKVLLAVLFVFLSCNAVFANVADTKSETNTSQSLNQVSGQDSSTNFVMAAVVAGNGDLVNYKREDRRKDRGTETRTGDRGRRHGGHGQDG